MSEKFNPEQSKEYRDELANKVKEIRTPSTESLELTRMRAEAYLEGVKERDKRYGAARETHLKKVEETVNSRWQEKATAEQRFSETLVNKYLGTIKNGIRSKAEIEMIEKGLYVDPRKIYQEAQYRVMRRGEPTSKGVMDERGRFTMRITEAVEKEEKEIYEKNREALDKYCEPLFATIDKEGATKEVLDGLKAIDEAFEDGIVADGGNEFDIIEFLEKDSKLDLIEYDEVALVKYIKGITDRVDKIRSTFRYDGTNVKQGEYSGIDKVIKCGGDHDGVSGIYFPTSFECSRGISTQVRLDKILATVGKFKRTPEQVEEARKKIIEEKEVEKEEKRKEKMDKFDPQI